MILVKVILIQLFGLYLLTECLLGLEVVCFQVDRTVYFFFAKCEHKNSKYPYLHPIELIFNF